MTAEPSTAASRTRMTQTVGSEYQVKIAETEAELRAAQRLRYDVFVQELGSSGPLVDHAERLERDHLDPFCDHILLLHGPVQEVVGVYRLLRDDQATRAGGFYSASEYDLGPLLGSGKRLLELGRSCLDPAHRGGMGMHHLWSSLAQYVEQHQIDILFGVASFPGTDPQMLAAPLSLLHHRHLAPAEMRAKALPEAFQNMDLINEAHLDRKVAMLQVPSLIKAYLRLGGVVGEGAYIDHAFNTTDVCLILDTSRLSARQARIYGGQDGA